MATLATFFRRSDLIAADMIVEREMADPYRLRSLPGDNVYFYSKRVDNSRLVRQADPRTRSECWSAVGTACLIAIMLGAAVSPRVGGILAGYRTEQLKQEQHVLLDERRVLQIQEAQMLSPERLDRLAGSSSLAIPGVGQEVRLEPRTDSSFALNVQGTQNKAQ